MRRLLPCAALVLALGCSSSPFSESNDLIQENATIVCECWEDIPTFGSQRECLDALDVSVTETQLECLERQYDALDSVGQAVIECQADAGRGYSSCLSDISGCDQTALESCIQEWRDAQDACPELSEGDQTRLSSCVD